MQIALTYTCLQIGAKSESLLVSVNSEFIKLQVVQQLIGSADNTDARIWWNLSSVKVCLCFLSDAALNLETHFVNDDTFLLFLFRQSSVRFAA